MDITPPPLWEHLLFERPWPLVTALLVGAILIRYVARQRNQPAMGYVALAMAAAAGGVIALSWFVTTDRQVLEQQTRALVAATESPANFTVIDRLLSEHAVLTGPDGAVWLEVSQIRDELEQAVGRYGIDDQTIRRIGAEIVNGHVGRSVFDLRTYTATVPGRPIPSVWTLYWEQDATGQWRITRIQWDEFMRDAPRQNMW